MAPVTGPSYYVGYRLVKEEASGLHLPPPQKSQETAEGNHLQVAATLQQPGSQRDLIHNAFTFFFQS